MLRCGQLQRTVQAKAKERTNILSDLLKEHDPHHDGTCEVRGFIAGIKALDNMIGLSDAVLFLTPHPAFGNLAL
jgi:hypothetical protein